MRDWVDAKGRLHRFLVVRDGRAHFKVEVPSTVVRSGFDPLVGGDSATYYSSTDDALIFAGETSYSPARNAGSGTLQLSATGINVGQYWYSPAYYVYRGVVFFASGDLPDTADISAAALHIYGEGDYSHTDFDVTVVSFSGSQPPVADDFDVLGTTSYGAASTSGFATDGYNTITLNATGIAAINKSGTTVFGLRSSRDISATTPTGAEYVRFYSADYDGGSRAPKLVVTYSVTVNVTITPPPGLLTIHSAAPSAGIAMVVAAPPGYLSIWPATPEIGTYVIVEAPSGLLTLLTASPVIIAGTGVVLSAPPAHLSIHPGWAVHEAPHLPHPIKVSRTRPSHWFSSRRDIVRK